MAGIHDIQYSYLISMIYIILCLVSIIFVICLWYPRYTLVLSGIHDSCIIYMSGSCLWFYVLWISCHQISSYLISEEVETMVYMSQSLHEICDETDDDPLMSCLVTRLGFMQNLITIDIKVWPPWGNTHTDRHIQEWIVCIYIYWIQWK